MNKFVVMPLAALDMDDIFSYISPHNPQAAASLIKRFYDTFQHLADWPGTGHVREDLTDKPVRFLSVKHYMIVYNPHGTPLEILRVVSSYRDIQTVL